jgi:hypothetical protein
MRSDLLRYVDGCDIDLMVINAFMYAKRQSSMTRDKDGDALPARPGAIAR